MERECFEDPQIAALMNERFVCIKVDREERPDVDAIYMDAVQAMTGPRRLAAERVPHARGRAVLRRHLLPARAAPGDAVVAAGPGRAWRRRGATSGREIDETGRRILPRLAGAAALPPAEGELGPGRARRGA